MGKTFAEAMLEKGMVTEHQVKAAERHKHAAQMKNYENDTPPQVKGLRVPKEYLHFGAADHDPKRVKFEKASV